jgi:hypothetical protein
MGRIEFMFGPMGLLLVVISFLVAGFMYLVGKSRGQGRSRRPSSGGLDLEFDTDAGDEQNPTATNFKNFGDFLNRFVLPRHAEHPEWERLDGAYEVPGRMVASFERNGTRYGVWGDTQFAPLILASEWLHEHPDEDPLLIQSSSGGAGRLQLRPEIGWKDKKAVHIESC